MDDFMILAIIIPASFILGLFYNKWNVEKKIGKAENKAKDLLEEAKNKVNKMEVEIEKKCYQNEIKLKDDIACLKEKAEIEIDKRKNTIHQQELDLKDKENSILQRDKNLTKKEKEIKRKQQSIIDKENYLTTRVAEVDHNISLQIEKLEHISGLSREEARLNLEQMLVNEARDNIARTIKDMRDQAREEADREAKEIIISAIQRTGADHSTDSTVSVVNLPSEEIKGRIIGREGRNIRSFEQATGIELIVDDTPGAVVISGFDPYRRGIAKLALEKLIEDGRIQPGRIEEVVDKAQKEMEAHIRELGKDTIIDLGMHKVHPELVKLIGRLHYRTSYGQNVLLHSIEVAKLCGLMAADLGYDEKIAKRAGLLHDIGKAIDQYQEGTHVQLGYELAKKYKEHPIVLNAIHAHHEDHPIEHPITSLVIAADAISSSRPGARRETLGNYLQRIEKLETLAQNFEGVSKAYAIQAGREIRVMVENEDVNDARADMLANDIAQKVEEEMKYPGQIKVTVIREYRAAGIAK